MPQSIESQRSNNALGITMSLEELAKEDAPRMGAGMHFVCTLLGVVFCFLTAYLVYQLFQTFTWPLFFGAVFSSTMAEEFLRGAFTQRYPVWALIFLATP